METLTGTNATRSDPVAGWQVREDPGADALPRPKGRPAGFDADRFAAELDAVGDQVMSSLGQADADHIRDLVKLQRRLELAGRAALMAGGRVRPMFLVGTTLLSLSKILENMEIGHNVMHGQWDWMRDPEINSTDWDWDNVCPADQWKHTHNHMHHQWTNIRGLDSDIGYGLMRFDPDEQWEPRHRYQPLVFVGLALAFEYGVALHHAENLSVRGEESGQPDSERMAMVFAKMRSQAIKDYAAWPAASLPFGIGAVISSLAGSVVANIVRNLWAFAVIFCGHFPDGVTFFDPEDVEGEAKGDYYRRQVLGSVNFTGGRVMDIMTGNLDHQIEHHIFPDMPANRYSEIQPEIRKICERHGVTYNTRSMRAQFGSVVRKAFTLSRRPA